jgi:hypothetical protein
MRGPGTIDNDSARASANNESEFRPPKASVAPPSSTIAGPPNASEPHETERHNREHQIASRLAEARSAIDDGRALDALLLLDTVLASASDVLGIGETQTPAPDATVAPRATAPDSRMVTGSARLFVTRWGVTILAVPALIGAGMALSRLWPEAPRSTPGVNRAAVTTPAKRDQITLRSSIVHLKAPTAPPTDAPPSDSRVRRATLSAAAALPPRPAVASRDAHPSPAAPKAGPRVAAEPPAREARLSAAPPAITSAPPPLDRSTASANDAASNRIANEAAASSPSASEGVREDVHIRSALDAYANAYDRLDARAAQVVWPGVDARALAKAFSSLESQSIDLGTCDVIPRGVLAVANCRGTSSYVTKVGRRQRQDEPRRWAFTLRKSGDRWTILSATTERRADRVEQ